MFSLKNIEEITNGKIINGNCSQQIKKYSTSNTNFDTGIFYVPIIFQKQNREKNITTAVRNGAIGFMINKNSTNYEEIINEAKKIKTNILFLGCVFF